ncbi:MAG: sigma-70 family RNA polymerase sigma factor [Hyphomonadaceae bacterium]|nr:sigma-70 family RNA polymerase sigma factor [Hyphomonadaceae bacterium]
MLALGFIAEAHHGESAQTPLQTTAWRDLELSLEREIERLPEAERTIIYNHYQLGVDFTQIAKLIGCSKGRVSQLHKSALARLRQHLSKFE